MKMIFITAIKSFELAVKNILKDTHIFSYTYADAIGFKDSSRDAINENWFATNMNENESIVFFVLEAEEKAQKLKQQFEVFNAMQDTQSKVHVAILNTEN